MELTTLLGIIAGFGFIIYSIVNGGELGSFIEINSILIVFGGTFAATIISFPLKTLLTMGSVLKCAFQKKEYNLQEDIELIVRLANTARQEGLLALENATEDMDSPFLKKGIMLVVDGSDPELVKSVMEAEIYFLQERHAKGQAVLDAMAGYAPAFGMVGTLIGLINMLKNLQDSSTLGPSMAVALITTFYGSLLANLIFTPLSRKLKAQTAAESQEKELLLEGLLSIQDGQNPRIIRDKLNAFISGRDLNKAEAQQNIKPEVEEVKE